MQSTNKRTYYKRALPSPPAIAFSSAAGRQIFAEALADGTMVGFFPLMEQFTTQEEPAYCGLAAMAMTLNALSIDPRRTWKGAWRWFSESMLDCTKGLEEIKREGITLSEVACLAGCNGADVQLFRCGTFTVDDLRAHLLECCSSEDTHLVVSYSRKVLLQSGDGHFSPIGGYHRSRDLVLILDVARFKYPPHWVRVSDLMDGMMAPDPATGKPRGFMRLSRPEIRESSLFTLDIASSGWLIAHAYVTRDVPALLQRHLLGDEGDAGADQQVNQEGGPPRGVASVEALVGVLVEHAPLQEVAALVLKRSQVVAAPEGLPGAACSSCTTCHGPEAAQHSHNPQQQQQQQQHRCLAPCLSHGSMGSLRQLTTHAAGAPAPEGLPAQRLDSGWRQGGHVADGAATAAGGGASGGAGAGRGSGSFSHSSGRLLHTCFTTEAWGALGTSPPGTAAACGPRHTTLEQPSRLGCQTHPAGDSSLPAHPPAAAHHHSIADNAAARPRGGSDACSMPRTDSACSMGSSTGSGSGISRRPCCHGEPLEHHCVPPQAQALTLDEVRFTNMFKLVDYHLRRAAGCTHVLPPDLSAATQPMYAQQQHHQKDGAAGAAAGAHCHCRLGLPELVAEKLTVLLLMAPAGSELGGGLDGTAAGQSAHSHCGSGVCRKCGRRKRRAPAGSAAVREAWRSLLALTPLGLYASLPVLQEELRYLRMQVTQLSYLLVAGNGGAGGTGNFSTASGCAECVGGTGHELGLGSG